MDYRVADTRCSLVYKAKTNQTIIPQDSAKHYIRCICTTSINLYLYYMRYIMYCLCSWLFASLYWQNYNLGFSRDHARNLWFVKKTISQTVRVPKNACFQQCSCFVANHTFHVSWIFRHLALPIKTSPLYIWSCETWNPNKKNRGQECKRLQQSVWLTRDENPWRKTIRIMGWAVFTGGMVVKFEEIEKPRLFCFETLCFQCQPPNFSGTEGWIYSITILYDMLY